MHGVLNALYTIATETSSPYYTEVNLARLSESLSNGYDCLCDLDITGSLNSDTYGYNYHDNTDTNEIVFTIKCMFILKLSVLASLKNHPDGLWPKADSMKQRQYLVTLPE